MKKSVLLLVLGAVAGVGGAVVAGLTVALDDSQVKPVILTFGIIAALAGMLSIIVSLLVIRDELEQRRGLPGDGR